MSQRSPFFVLKVFVADMAVTDVSLFALKCFVADVSSTGDALYVLKIFVADVSATDGSFFGSVCLCRRHDCD